MGNITDNNMDNLNNSHAAKDSMNKKASKPKTEAVAQGKMKGGDEESKSLVQRFIKNDAKSIWSYLFTKVLDPTVRKLLYDLGTNTIHMLLYEGAKKNPSSSTARADQVSYRKYYDDPEYTPKQSSSTKWGFKPVSYGDRDDAENVLKRMREIVDRYTFVTAADYYELSGFTEFPYTCNEYGWKDLDNVDVIPNDDPDDSNEWIIDLPKPRPRR